ncbi:TPA: DNA repair protein RadA [Candidatus Dependentiae bacterium]|nr:MAG: repair protein radA protein [candidate division TM6 bacterium GW2011_GWE2_31_21]KKP54019.1 MAG: repair protein radA protein [candidate division TM6 bacterium GW2011_GWF2_33_332]HBS48399.1 DNA repair protein RadA [Candidatus Dependentiae bacterium]HBZ72927.1 DNA repair protein RadA [Candidatus Dependentiae bacterium]
MKSSKSQFNCTNCGYVSIKWAGCCPGCNEWNSFVEKTIEQKQEGFKSKIHTTSKANLYTLNTIQTVRQERIVAGIKEWDRVLGGGIFPGSFLILTGDPGIGKSTLLLQIANKIAATHKVLYFSSEESLEQVKNRAMRLKCHNEHLLFSDQASMEKILTTAVDEKPDLLILDSIQNCYFEKSETIPGTIGQLRESSFHLMKLAKENNIAVLVTGHITKDGYMAGPKLLEHMVDGLFYLQGEDRWQTRVLRAMKNRFGAINEIGFFEMQEHGLSEITDINKYLLNNSTPAAGSALITCIEGTRPLILELQSLCVASKFGIPQRVVSGVDPKQIVLIAAILEKYLKIRLSGYDIFFKVSSSFKIKEEGSDLGIALALLSSYFQKPLPQKSISIGEISLTGQIKPCTQLEHRVKEAEKFGIETLFLSALQKPKTSCNVVSFKHIYELLNLFPEE